MEIFWWKALQLYGFTISCNVSGIQDTLYRIVYLEVAILKKLVS